MPEDTRESSVCATCTQELSVCACAHCDECGSVGGIGTICAACAQCEDCCECEHCSNCDRNTAEALCSTCHECEECCACAVCARSRCGARVETVCDRCDRCEECCECAWCAACQEHVEYTCGNCERCEENCCECSYCEACQERHNSETDFCSECSSCEDNCNCTKAIYDYNTDVMDHLQFQGTPESGLYLGAELEVQVETGGVSDKAEAWNAAAGDFSILKYDGSVSHGFEVVTAPCSLAVHAEKWTELLNQRDMVRGLKSWNSERACCGMHVHVSRAPISPLTLGKLLVFINSDTTEAPIVALAGRNSDHWAQRSPKKLTGHLYRCIQCGTLRKARSNPCCKKCKQGYYADRVEPNTGRYQALNLQNEDTIEFRIFRGTLLLEHVLANIQFCDAVVRWCMQCSIQECESWSSFWAYVTKHQKIYKQLISYMATKGY
jgi:hypothetical protein